jgi:hypothetical protein
MSDLPTNPDVEWLAPFREGARQCAEASFLRFAFTAITVEEATATLLSDLKMLLNCSIRSTDVGPEDKELDAAMTKAIHDSFRRRVAELVQYPVPFKGAPQ